MKKSLHIHRFSKCLASALVVFGDVAFGVAADHSLAQDAFTVSTDFTAKESVAPSEKITLTPRTHCSANRNSIEHLCPLNTSAEFPLALLTSHQMQLNKPP